MKSVNGHVEESLSHVSDSEVKSPEENELKCTVCGMEFILDWDLKIHEKSHIGTYCSQCNVTVADYRDFLQHQKGPHKKNYVCLFCGKLFPQLSNRKRHEKIHLGQKDYVCGVCGKSYSDKRDLVRHINRLHINEAQESSAISDCIIRCEHGENRARPKEELEETKVEDREGTEETPKAKTDRIDVRTDAQGREKPFREETDTANESVMERDWRCKVCGEGFPSGEWLSFHRDHVDHGEKTSKELKCENCPFTTTELAKLALHLRYRCIPASEAFKFTGSDHTGLMPDMCLTTRDGEAHICGDDRQSGGDKFDIEISSDNGDKYGSSCDKLRTPGENIGIVDDGGKDWADGYENPMNKMDTGVKDSSDGKNDIDNFTLCGKEECRCSVKISCTKCDPEDCNFQEKINNVCQVCGNGEYTCRCDSTLGNVLCGVCDQEMCICEGEDACNICGKEDCKCTIKFGNVCKICGCLNCLCKSEVNSKWTTPSLDYENFKCHICGIEFRDEEDLGIHEKMHGFMASYTSFVETNFTQEEMILQKRRYMCSFCGKVFTSGFNMRRHEKIHLGLKEFTCEQCGRLFSEKGNLEQHMQTHNPNRIYKCTLCEVSYGNRKYLVIHKKTHRGEYRCKECGIKFEGASDLKKHRKVHSVRRVYICGVCGRKYKSAAGLKLHKRKGRCCKVCGCLDCKCEIINSIKGEIDEEKEEKESKSDTEEDCVELGVEEQPSEIEDSENLRKETDVVKAEDTCNPHEGEHSALSHPETLESNVIEECQYTCDVCELGFSSNSELKLHEVIHMDTYCASCEIRVRHYGDFLEHKKGPHKRTWVCQFCGKLFQQLSNRKRHEKIHLGQRDFFCNVCGRSYCDKRDLKNHIYRLHGDMMHLYSA